MTWYSRLYVMCDEFAQVATSSHGRAGMASGTPEMKVVVGPQHADLSTAQQPGLDIWVVRESKKFACPDFGLLVFRSDFQKVLSQRAGTEGRHVPHVRA